MTDESSLFLTQTRSIFQKQKTLAERAMAQLTDEEIFGAIDPEANSIAVLVRHLRGNMRSRWTDFMASDGEKPDRQRDTEFLDPDSRDRAQIEAWWEEGWGYLFSALDGLKGEDLTRSVTIRGEAVTVLAAILRAFDHYAQHVGQIVLLAKHARGSRWQSLSIPRGQSEQYLAQLQQPK